MQLTVNTLNLSFFLFIVFYGLNLGAVASPGDLLEKKKLFGSLAAFCSYPTQLIQET